jgi:hypothetical protein
MDNSELKEHLNKHYGCLSTSYDDAKRLPPRGPWTGIMFCTISPDRDSVWFKGLFKAWLPRDAVVVTHGSKSRSQILSWVPDLSGHYKMRLSKLVHANFGGVTTSSWHLVHFSREHSPITARTVMTEDHYTQCLQASLDDTVSKSPSEYSFELESGKDYRGTVRLKKTGATLRVYDGESLGPDLHLITTARFLFFWVIACSV